MSIIWAAETNRADPFFDNPPADTERQKKRRSQPDACAVEKPAGITPESADPETFLQDTVPAQENGPEALVAEEIPLPQDETVLQEEMTDLPDADVPVSETPLADDLLAAIRSEAIQLSHQEFQHSNSASTPDVASAAVLRG